uniref:Uncharacterized protein n=1 Tax=Homo sapiens TaxID=9606 RepID=A0A0K2QJH7_HUMAN|nr:hypothetical protein 2 [Homo sapiens]
MGLKMSCLKAAAAATTRPPS